MNRSFVTFFTILIMAVSPMFSTGAETPSETPHFKRGAELIKENGWSFLDQDGNELKTGEIASAIERDFQLLVMSPHNTDVDARMPVQIRYDREQQDGVVGFTMAILDSGLKKELTSRVITMDTNVTPEENRINFERSLRGMAAEIQLRKKELAKSVSLDQWFTGLTELFIPSAKAGYNNSDETNLMLYRISSFSFFAAFSIIAGLEKGKIADSMKIRVLLVAVLTSSGLTLGFAAIDEVLALFSDHMN